MARPQVITKDMLLKYGVNFVQKYGFKNISSRKVANEFGISTQPIYNCFKNMADYKEEIVDYIYNNIFDKELKKKYNENPIINDSIAFVRFGEKNPKLYLAMFIEGTSNNRKVFLDDLDNYYEMIKNYPEYSSVSNDFIENIHMKSWIITNGLVASSLSGLRKYSTEELTIMFEEMIRITFENPNHIKLDK